MKSFHDQNKNILIPVASASTDNIKVITLVLIGEGSGVKAVQN